MPARLTALAATLLLATNASAKTLSLNGISMEVSADEAEIVAHAGRESLRLLNGIAWLDVADFRTGTISFDIAVDHAVSFHGIRLRAMDERNMEHFYIRPIQSGFDDAVQYAPTDNGITAWQIFADRNATANVTFAFDRPMPIRLVMAEDAADLYIDGDLVLHVPDLKRDPAAGRIAIYGRRAPAHISNLRVEPGRPALAGAPAPAADPPNGLIETWRVSKVLEDAELNTRIATGARMTDGLALTALPVESNGIANLARLSGRTPEASTVFASFHIHAEMARAVAMRFGFSDRVQLFLNGQRLFSGDDAWRTRDARFLGTVGPWYSVDLPLRAGENEVVMAVGETFGGWAAMAAIEDRAGLTITP